MRLTRVAPASALMPAALTVVLALLCSSNGRADEIPADEAALREQAKQTFKEQVTPFVNTYCVQCHGSRPEAGINLSSALKDPGTTSSALHWKKAVANVKVHDMPPADAGKQPTEEERQRFIDGIASLKYLAPRDPGPFVMRRLSKSEYGNTLHALYGVNRSITDSLPDEVVGEGYLNSISPLQSELYLDIANKVVAQVISPDGNRPTRLQRQLFGAAPNNCDDPRQLARDVATRLARDAYRRPATQTELDVLVDVFDLGLENDLDHSQALTLMWKAILVSPQFLFITPAVSSDAVESPGGNTIIPLDDYQLASRLSYLLWAAPPDKHLSALAERGELHQPDVLRAEVDRLLNDQRARALFDGFGAQWLGLNSFASQLFDPELFPEMNPTLRAAMMDEARLFFQSVVQEDQSVFRFIDSDYTFVNQPLAELYGLEQCVQGPEMRRVQLQNSNRGGILGMPVTLASTSFSTRTSPVKRGVWVLEQILGERVPPPPPNVPELEEQEQVSREGLTLRQLTALHQSESTCANCHRILDPIGFGLENFDAIGRWRDEEQPGSAIDSAGTLPTGEAFSTPAELKQVLASRTDDVARNVLRRFLAYAIGRQLEGYDEVVVDQLMLQVAADDYRMRTMIREIIGSYLFTHRRVTLPTAD